MSWVVLRAIVLTGVAFTLSVVTAEAEQPALLLTVTL
jgi:hypothetical protein